MSDAFNGRFSALSGRHEAGRRLFTYFSIGRELKAGKALGVILVQVVIAQALNIVVRRIHIRVGQQHNADILARL